MAHHAQAALLEWGCMPDDSDRLTTPNGRIRWSKAPHGWYREDLNARGEFQGLAFKLMRGGPHISPWLTPELWVRRDELAEECKVIVDVLAPYGLDEFSETLPFVQQRLADAELEHDGSDAIGEIVRFWRGLLSRLETLTYCVAWPDAYVEDNYRRGLEARAERAQAQAVAS